MAHVDADDLSRFLRGQLSPERAKEVELHLAACAQCAELFSMESQGPTADARPGEEPSYATDAAFSEKPASPPVPAVREPATPKWLQEERAPDRGEQVGRYLVLERVGKGGMGIVYSAWDPDLGRRVAIKLLRSDKRHSEGRSLGQARLLREAQAMARVSHPQVISVFDVGTLGDRVFIAMEFVDGPTLKKWVKEKPRSWREVLDTFLAAGRGLAGAHAVGLVHRDFKPENVLIGKDGRVRVTDFGLARLAEEDADPTSPALPPGAPVEDGPELGQLTQDGQAVGTPMYMAPEQRSGKAPDARADQYSFCVALYWALYGTWPFDRQRSSGKDPDHSPNSSHKGTSRSSQRADDARPVDPSTGAYEPPRDSKVPAFVRRAIMRGLSPAAQDRFTSMDALLAQLEYRPRRIRLAAGASALALVATVGVYTAYAQQAAQRQALLCTGAKQQLAGIWDDEAKRRVTQGLVATGKPDAADVAQRVTRVLDGYASAWEEASNEACRATRIRGEQTEQLLSLRVVCLERRLQDVKAITGVLANADAALVPKAVDAVSLLPSLKSCANVATLSQVEPPPESPQAREELGRISSQVAQIKALTDAGRYKQALELAEPTVKAASTLKYRPLEAEALLWQGWLKVRSGAPAAAEAHYSQALWAAFGSRNDEVVARAAMMLVYAVAFDPKRGDVALQWSELAKSALARMGGNEDIESDLFNNVGVVHARQGRNAEALTAFQRALQLAERAVGQEHVRRASILANIGNIHRKEGRFDEASRALSEALALRERLSGPQHPIVGTIHYSLAQALLRLPDFENAQTHARRALEIDIATFGPEHINVGGSYDVVGHVYLEQKKYQEALEAYQKALAIKEKSPNKSDEELGYSANGLARCYLELGDAARAQQLYERVLALKPPDPRIRGDVYFGLARALEAQGQKRAQALEFARKARGEYGQVKEQQRVADVDAWLAKRSGTRTSLR